MPSGSLPSTSVFLHATLRYLKSHPEGARRRDVYEGVADLIPLTTEQRHATTQNGIPKHHYRTGFSLGELRSSKLAANPDFGMWRITQEGLALLTAQPNEITLATAHEILSHSKETPQEDGKIEGAPATPIPIAPIERIDAALVEIQAELANELLSKILEQQYVFLEKLVLDLLHKMYGTSRDDLLHVGKAGDQGIDGIVSLDKLGFDKIYVQAKLWQSKVGGGEVRHFIGALSQKNAQKGVLITTSSFTHEALKAATAQSPRVALIDGLALCKLMIEHGVGATSRQIQVPALDLDYFEGDN